MGTSPAQRLMNRRTKTLLPTKQSLLEPEVPDLKEQGRTLVRLKERQAHYYNRGAKDLKPLKIQDLVRIAPPDGIGQSKEWKKGVVNKVLPNRSYEVQSAGQHYRRNRRHLRPSKHQEQSESDDLALEDYREIRVEQEKPIQMSDSKQMIESAKEQDTLEAPQCACSSIVVHEIMNTTLCKKYYGNMIILKFVIKFRKVSTRLELTEPSSALRTGAAESMVHCCLICTTENKCISVLYDKKNRTCQLFNFLLNWDQLGDEKGTEYLIMDNAASNRRLPRSCSDIAGCSGITKDGEYWLYPVATNGTRVKIYCHDMQTDPKEYVTMKNENCFIQHDPSNWLSKNERCTTTYTPPLKKAVFSKVAINIQDMSVDGTDYTFAVRTGDFNLTFGQTSDCAGEIGFVSKTCPRFSGAKINAQGTGMIFDPTIVFGIVEGYMASILDFQRSADGAEMYFRCGGWCGICGPVEGEMKFILTTEAGETT
ncbi:uncharacterized protein LOC134234634 [Saccostrea cucullata]|uniref:uncharacterized protein LOC134234634 n=1 Tax=Saccostrea cuccullata TaxID=36930 RepID=UPI002ED03D16